MLHIKKCTRPYLLPFQDVSLKVLFTISDSVRDLHRQVLRLLFLNGLW